MNVVIWIVQIVLGLAFLMAGGMKLTQPLARLATRMGWVESFGETNVRLIGLAEVLGAVGLIIPAATKILPWLTPTAAIALTILMVGAVFVHLNRRENAQSSAPLILLILCLIVAIGRSVSVPIS